MKQFLAQVSLFLKSKHQNNFGKVLVLTPNQRSILFIRKHFKEIYHEAVWLPEMLSISEFVSKTSGLVQADKTILLTCLYKQYSKLKSSPESFDDFYFWGEILLNDFSDIDKNLVSAKDLYSNLIDLKSIDQNFSYLTDEQRKLIEQFWGSIQQAENDNFEKQFIENWQHLPVLYENFRSFLIQAGFAYDGLLYRQSAEILAQDEKVLKDYDKIYFIGFNALSTAEFEMMRYLQNRKKAVFIYDYDTNYLNDKNNPAAYFTRKNMSHFPPAEEFEFVKDSSTEPPKDLFSQESGIHKAFSFNNLTSTAKSINIFEASSYTGQSYILPDLLRKLPQNEINPTNTAIVLADEQLLPQVLDAISAVPNPVNISMGYPIGNTLAFTFLSKLIDFNKSLIRNKSKSIPLSELFNLAGSQLGKLVFPDFFAGLLNFLQKKSVRYITRSELDQLECPGLFFIEYENQFQFLQRLTDHFTTLFSLLLDEKITLSNLEKEAISQLIIRIRTLHESLKIADVEMNLDTLSRIILKSIKEAKIPFSGEPLKGIQVCGLLETRLLDFKHVIVLSMNEGILPLKKYGNSYIPFNLRKAFGLPVFQENDAVYSYNFFRLIQRAKKIDLIYGLGKTGGNDIEESRFIKQLNYLSGIKTKFHKVKLKAGISNPDPISVSKSEAIMNSLQAFFSSGDFSRSLSPTAISTYISCKLQFYFKYIEGIKANELPEEEISGADFGSLFHEAAHQIYKGIETVDSGFVNNNLTDKHLKQKVNEALSTIFLEGKNTTEFLDQNGAFLLMAESVKRYLKRLTELDKQHAPFNLLALEKKFSSTLPLPLMNAGLEKNKVNISGTIDRIDSKDGIVRIIDYKTGSDEVSISEIRELFSDEKIKDKKAILQILIYTWLFRQNYPDAALISPVIVKVKELFKDGFKTPLLNKQILNINNIMDEFEELLSQKLAELFNPEVSFSQTSVTEHCTYCDYQSICQTQKRKR